MCITLLASTHRPHPKTEQAKTIDQCLHIFRIREGCDTCYKKCTFTHKTCNRISNACTVYVHTIFILTTIKIQCLLLRAKKWCMLTKTNRSYDCVDRCTRHISNL